MPTKRIKINPKKELFPYVDITLTAEELKILRPKTAELLRLYLVLNQLRDFDTNIAGLVTHISDGAFKDWLEIPGTQGRKKWRPSTTHLQRWLGQLVDLGLIEDRGNYVFYLPFACVRKQSEETVKNLSHQNCYQTVTTTVTNEEIKKIPINTGVTEEIKNEVSLQVSPEVSPLLYLPPTIPDKDNDDDRARGIFKPFLELISQQGFPFHQVLGNAKTTLMIKEWVDKGVTIEEARTGINEANAYLGSRPSSPQYYLSRVLQVKKAMEKITQSANEVNNANTTRRSNRTISNTEAFFNEGVAALAAHRRRKD